MALPSVGSLCCTCHSFLPCFNAARSADLLTRLTGCRLVGNLKADGESSAASTTIPPEIGTLRELRALIAPGIGLVGTVPESLWKLPYLFSLFVQLLWKIYLWCRIGSLGVLQKFERKQIMGNSSCRSGERYPDAIHVCCLA